MGGLSWLYIEVLYGSILFHIEIVDIFLLLQNVLVPHGALNMGFVKIRCRISFLGLHIMNVTADFKSDPGKW